MKQIFIVGHSAGAQFSQLYSAGNSIEEKYTNINFGYWIANSQFFLYTNPNRWSDTDGDFIVPDESLCQGYDEYPRGMVDRNTFMNKLSSGKIIQNISSRKVTTFGRRGRYKFCFNHYMLCNASWKTSV